MQLIVGYSTTVTSQRRVLFSQGHRRYKKPWKKRDTEGTEEHNEQGIGLEVLKVYGVEGKTQENSKLRSQ